MAGSGLVSVFGAGEMPWCCKYILAICSSSNSAPQSSAVMIAIATPIPMTRPVNANIRASLDGLIGFEPNKYCFPDPFRLKRLSFVCGWLLLPLAFHAAFSVPGGAGWQRWIVADFALRIVWVQVFYGISMARRIARRDGQAAGHIGLCWRRYGCCCNRQKKTRRVRTAFCPAVGMEAPHRAAQPMTREV